MQFCVLLALLGLYACAGFSWEKLNWEGPIIEGNIRAAAFKSCGGGSVEFHTCIIALVDQNGTKLDTDNDIAEVVDSYLASVPPLSPWVARIKKWGSYPSSEFGRFPYRLHLLTISPIVVLAVPLDDREPRDQCNGAQTGCIYSRALDVTFSFNEPPKIRPGSFWFSPDLKIPQNPIPTDQTSVSINLGSSTLKLIPEGETWKVLRDPVKPRSAK